MSKTLNMLDPHRKVYLNIEKKREEKNTIITKSFWCLTWLCLMTPNEFQLDLHILRME